MIVKTSITTIEPVPGTKSPINGRSCRPSKMNGYTIPSTIRLPASHQPRSERARVPKLWIASLTLRALRRPLAENALRAEDEHRDQDPEHDRAGPVAARRPVEALVESLHHPDHHRPEDGARQVPDAPEHRRRERDQPELETGVVADVEL